MSLVWPSSLRGHTTDTSSLAIDLAPEGITAVLVNPGHVQSGIGGKHAPMTAAESVTHLRAVIAGLTPSDAGKFLHFDGKEIKL